MPSNYFKYPNRNCKYPIISAFIVLLVVVVAGCDGKWSTPHAAPGPLPLAPPGATITRLKREKPTFEVTYEEILWDDGSGPVKMEDRVKRITDGVPKDLLDKLHSTRKALDVTGKPYDQIIHDARAVVVALNPDVLIVSIGETLPPKNKGELNWVFSDWDRKEGRWQLIEQRLQRFGGYWEGDFPLYAGPLVAFSEEIYVVSTDPKVEYRRLNFVDDRAIVPLPNGKLIFTRHGIDVEVSRE